MTAIDAIMVLVHRIQATHATDNAGALLLFNISSFYDNLNPVCLTSVLCHHGFLDTICD